MTYLYCLIGENVGEDVRPADLLVKLVVRVAFTVHVVTVQTVHTLEGESQLCHVMRALPIARCTR